MAGGFAGADAGAGRAEQYEGRITSYFILACIVGSFGGSLFGYDLGVSSEYTRLPYCIMFVLFTLTFLSSVSSFRVNKKQRPILNTIPGLDAQRESNEPIMKR